MEKKLLVDCINFSVDHERLTESMQHINGRLLVQGVIQRANSLNQNKRFYPKSILMREVEKYQQFVKERRALGELDHPESCFSESAEILTSAGWKFIKDISNDENIFTLNMDTCKPEYKIINKKIINNYTGIMYRFKGKNINTLVTPNHRFVVEDRYGKLLFKTAEELYELNDKHSHLKILRLKEKKNILYIFKFNKYIHIDGRFLSIEKEQFSGNTYCVSVPNETFYVRDNNQCFWSGNSVINLSNVSHLITELWWEGDDLLGKLEILGTPSGNILKELFRSGISVGISSRGLGSTKDIGDGAVEVDDDFEILGWDCVSNPSTQGSFIRPLTESVSKELGEESKYLKINNIIMDILISLSSK